MREADALQTASGALEGGNRNEDFEMSADDRNCTGRFGVDAFVWLCTGLIYISGLVLGLLSTIIALLGVAVLITYSRRMV